MGRKQNQPCNELETLMVQAHEINDWYQVVAGSWAGACGASHERVKPKATKRALEKIFRSYRGKVAPLTDIVRSSIVCEDAKQIRWVLEIIFVNSIVHVVKNQLSPSYDGNDSYGYRDIQLQLSFSEMDGTKFQGFVFEMQVHLRQIFELKYDSGHDVYVRLRNLLGS